MSLEFDEALFTSSVDPTHSQVQANVAPHEQRTKPDALNSKQAGVVETTTLQQQNFYPTPNSTNMHAGTNNSQFMSPFITNFQSYSHNNSDATFAELDELLFTPMMSPAMTPMQQYNSAMQSTEVDWEQFDKNFFALTDSAIDSTQAPQQVVQATENIVDLVQSVKKQRVNNGSSKTSRQTSPTTSYATSSQLSSSYHHKRNSSMAAPLHRPRSDKESSFESSEDVSPVDLNQFIVPASTVESFNGEHIHPITPSMLMSLQKGTDIPDSAHDVTSEISSSQNPSIPSDLQLMPSPSLFGQAGNGRQSMTPRSHQSAGRDIRPRPIAPARTQSITSSPALGPQVTKPSPDIRPILPGGMSPQVGAILASKSNYQHIVDGTYDQLNITYPQGMTQGLEVRRTSHKAAEQKRRDHLKDCFELLRTILPDRPEPGASKVAILKKGYEHILSLHEIVKTKDAEIASLKEAAKNTKE